jgi:hypothetical protein
MERISNDKSCRDKRLLTVVTAVLESAAVLASEVVVVVVDEKVRKPAVERLTPRRGRDRDTQAMVDDDVAANMMKRKEKRCIDYKDLSKKRYGLLSFGTGTQLWALLATIFNAPALSGERERVSEHFYVRSMRASASYCISPNTSSIIASSSPIKQTMHPAVRQSVGIMHGCANLKTARTSASF